MKAFRFKLEKKLNVSSIEEELAKENLRSQISSRDEVAGILDAVNSQVLHLETSIRGMNYSGQEYQKMITSREYLPLLQEKRNTICEKLEKAEEKVDKARDAVIGCSRETNTLKKLRERDFNSYVYELRREEQKIMDEMAIGLFYRNKNSEIEAQI